MTIFLDDPVEDRPGKEPNTILVLLSNRDAACFIVTDQIVNPIPCGDTSIRYPHELHVKGT
jgi:hypothetical protein